MEYTTTTASVKLGITPQRVRMLIKAKRLPARRVGRDYIINEEDLKLVADRKPGNPGKGAK